MGNFAENLNLGNRVRPPLTIYIRKTIYFAYAKLYVLYKVYTFAYAKTYTCAKHIVLHNYAKLYVLHNLWKTIYFE